MTVVNSFYATDSKGNQVDGSWTDASAWSQKIVPGKGADAGVAAAYTHTILYDTTDEIHSFGSSGAVLNMTGGSLTIDSGFDGDGGSVVYQGAIDVGGGASLILGTNAGLYQVYGLSNVGMVTIDPGATLLTGGMIGGTIQGGGTLKISASTLTTSHLTVGSLDVVGSVTLGASLTYGGTFLLAGNNAVLLKGHPLTLSGASITLGPGAEFVGDGTVDIKGAATVNSFATTVTSGAGVTFEDAGTITQTGTFAVGGTLTIDQAATYTITAASNITDNGNAVITNNGSFTDNSPGGTSQIGGFPSTVTNNGTLTIDAGDTLQIFGTDTLGGTIKGAGTLEIYGTAKITTNVTVGTIEIAGSVTTLGAKFTAFGGVFSFVGEAAVDLQGQTVTLSGHSDVFSNSTFAGPGTIKVTGSATVASFTLEGITLEDAGKMTQSNNLTILDHAFGGSDVLGKLLIDNGATYTLTGSNTSIDLAGNGGSIVNNGLFVVDVASKAGNAETIGNLLNNATVTIEAGVGVTLTGAGGNAVLVNNGTLNAAGGSLVITRALQASGAGAGLVDIGAGQAVTFQGAVASNQEVVFKGASGKALIDDPSQFAAKIAAFGAADIIDLDTTTYRSTYEAKFVVGATGGVLEIIDTAQGNAIVSTLALTGNYSGGLFALSKDANGNTDITFKAYQGFDFGSGNVVVSNVSGQSYSAYESLYESGVSAGVVDIFTKVPAGSAFSASEQDYSLGKVLIGKTLFYTAVTGKPYTGYDSNYDGGGHLMRQVFTGVRGAAYSSYEHDYVEGILVGTKYEFTTVPTGAAYTSYETEYNAAGTFTGRDLVFTNVTGQSYTGEDEDFDAAGKLVSVLMTGVTHEAYSSIERDYSAGVYQGYKAFVTAITGQSYTARETDYSAANAITKEIFTGYSKTPYSSLEIDFANGKVKQDVYDVTDVTGKNYYADETIDDASGHPLQQIFDNNNDTHTIIGDHAGQTLTSIGDDTFTGGGASEHFVFNAAYGHDTITDFRSDVTGSGHDTISFSKSEYTTIGAVLAAASDVGSNLVITHNGDTLTLDNMTKALLTANQGDITLHA